MNNEEFAHIDLFSGIGGFTLAGEWAGFRTIVFCEKEPFCQKVLQKRFGAIIADPKSMGWRNGITENERKESRKINSLSNETPLLIPDIRDFDGTKWRGATLLTGGFPCQPFSDAGKKRGKEDDRYLWPEMLRVIKEAKPRWILAENVPGIFHMALDTVLADLEGESYTTGTLIIPACGLNAPHRRNRIWIIANSIRTGARNQGREINNQRGQIGQDRRESIRQRNGTIGSDRIISTNNYASDSTRRRKKSWPKRRASDEYHQNTSDSSKWESRQSEARNGRQDFERGDWKKSWYEVAARFCRVDDGVPDRIHRLKALGNAIVPQIAYEILKGIAQIERTL